MWVLAGGEGHHDGRPVPGAGAGPSQGAGRPLGSRLALHAGQHHRPLADLLARRSQPVRLQGECRLAAASFRRTYSSYQLQNFANKNLENDTSGWNEIRMTTSKRAAR